MYPYPANVQFCMSKTYRAVITKKKKTHRIYSKNIVNCLNVSKLLFNDTNADLLDPFTTILTDYV